MEKECQSCKRVTSSFYEREAEWQKTICEQCVRAEEEEMEVGDNRFTLNFYTSTFGHPIEKDECPHVVEGKWPGSYKLEAVMHLEDGYGNDYHICLECLKNDIKRVEEIKASKT